MSASESKIVRAALKAELGLNSRAVGVRSPHYCSVNVSIHDPKVSLEAVEKIANRVQSIDRCEITGEIMQGGNTFVFVEYSQKAKDAIKEERAEEIEAIKHAAVKLAQDLQGETFPHGRAEVLGVDLVCDGYQWYLKKENAVYDRVYLDPKYDSSIALALLKMN